MEQTLQAPGQGVALPRAVLAAFIGGAIAGTLDLGSAVIVFHKPPYVIMQAIAGGLIGMKESFSGGMGTAVLGFALQMFISIVAAAIFVAVAIRFPILMRRWLSASIGFGICVYIVMNDIVLPLSKMPPSAFSWPAFIVAILVHMFVYALAISLTARLMLFKTSAAR